MTSTEALQGLRVVLRSSARNYLADNPWPVLIGAEWSRAVLQCLFFTMLGASWGEPRAAFLGALVMILMLFSVLDVMDLATLDKYSGTQRRIVVARFDPYLLCLVRALPLIMSGVVAYLASAVAVGAVYAQPEWILDALAVTPFVLLIGFSTSSAALVVAATALASRSDVVASNALLYFVTLSAGLLTPLDKLPALSAVGAFLPAQHGMSAIRRFLEGDWWLHSAALELCVCVGWCLLGVIMFRIQNARALRKGTVDFF